MEKRRVRGAVVLAAATGLGFAVVPAGSGQAAGHTPSRPGCIFDRLMLRTKADSCRPYAVAYPHSVKGPVRRAVYDGALTFGIPYQILLRIARCESSLNPGAQNGPHVGLFQFLPETFTRGAQNMRRETGIRASNAWNARDASYVAGYLFATGYSFSWSCE